MKATPMPFSRESRSEIHRNVTTSQPTYPVRFDCTIQRHFKDGGIVVYQRGTDKAVLGVPASSAVFLISAGNQTAEDAEGAEEQPDRK